MEMTLAEVTIGICILMITGLIVFFWCYFKIMFLDIKLMNLEEKIHSSNKKRKGKEK